MSKAEVLDILAKNGIIMDDGLIDTIPECSFTLGNNERLSGIRY